LKMVVWQLEELETPRAGSSAALRRRQLAVMGWTSGTGSGSWRVKGLLGMVLLGMVLLVII